MKIVLTTQSIWYIWKRI